MQTIALHVFIGCSEDELPCLCGSKERKSAERHKGSLPGWEIIGVTNAGQPEAPDCKEAPQLVPESEEECS